MNFTQCQTLALEVLNSKQSVFLTGGAGTGKSFLIREFLSSRSPGPCAVLASTGAAALLLRGRTFHSFFGLGIMQGGSEAVLQKARDNSRLKKRLIEAEMLIIDEVSMLPGIAFDCAERIARELRRVDEPWGGLKIVAVGDFSQLPPVSRDRGVRRDWIFESPSWEAADFRFVELEETVRTDEPLFLEILNDLRRGQLTPALEEFLDSRVAEEVDPDIPHLFGRREIVAQFNRSRLADLGSDLHVIETKYSGGAQGIEALKRDAPVPDELELKEGALVMIRVNDPQQRFVNGTTGTVSKVRADKIEIKTAERRIELKPFTFSVLDADGQEVAQAVNFPVSLAYASTIHKIQGATLSRAHVDLGAVWEPGQAYVALSRVRRARDLTLSRWSKGAIKADPAVQHFYSRFGKGSDLKRARL